MKFHKTKDGKEILLSDLELSHLENIINLIERKSIDGCTSRIGGGSCVENMWYDEDTYYGEEAKRELNFYDYVSEWNRRRSARA